MSFSVSAKDRLTRHDLGRFAGTTLFDRIARACCEAGCLPRKELYEAWEVARRVRRRFRGGRVVDMAAGHALLAHILLILDDGSPDAIAVDEAVPASAALLHDALIAEWPRVSHRVRFVDAALETIDLSETDLVVSCHACGGLTDRVLELAAAAGARVAVLPCCHDLRSNDAGPLAGWMDGALAIDAVRAMRLEQQGYRVWTQTIPAEITPKNRLLIGESVRRVRLQPDLGASRES